LNTTTIDSLAARVERLGVALAPNGDAFEVEGILNPASARTRDGTLLIYPRCVAGGNVSRVGLVEASGEPANPAFARLGFALEPQSPSELRGTPGGYGCEDPRVTFVPLLDSYVMAYTAFGPAGPRIAIALSREGYVWDRLGVVDFSGTGRLDGDDKDGVFFPEPVTSPSGVKSLALYHRPMTHFFAPDGRAAAQIALERPHSERECTRIAYIPLDAVLADRRALLAPVESVCVLETVDAWGAVKNGAGTPPVRIAEGWFSLFHGVDAISNADGTLRGLVYSAGMVVHDAERPHLVRYRSPEPVFAPTTPGERKGVVSDVVFPTAIDRRPGASERDFDVYYGMADALVGRVRIVLDD